MTLCKSKSFNLVNEEKDKQPARFYEPRRVTWMKYIIIPACLLLMLVLIIYNVDFSSDTKETNETTSISLYMGDLCATNSCTFISSKCKLICNASADNHSDSQQVQCFSEIQQLLEECSHVHANMSKLVNFLARLDKSDTETLPNSLLNSQLMSAQGAEFFQMLKVSYNGNKVSSRTLRETQSSPQANREHRTARDKEKQRKARELPYEKTVTASYAASTSATVYTAGTRPDPTTPSTTTTEAARQFVEIICTNASAHCETKTVYYNAEIQLANVTKTEANFILSQLDVTNWLFVYFEEFEQLHQEINFVSNYTTEDELMVTISNLTCSTPYVFCLVAENNLISPLNCRSHRTENCEAIQIETWFEANHELILGLSIAAIFLFTLVGLLAMYGILLLRPSLLRGSKRLIPTSGDSQKMLLLLGDKEQEEYGISGLNLEQNDCYIDYYRRFEQAKLYQTLPNPYNTPPKESAPSIPASQQKNSTPCAIQQQSIVENYLYECMELYEELP